VVVFKIVEPDMRMGLALSFPIAAAFVAIVPLTAHAQTRAPTDIELRAAYCTGVTQTQLKLTDSLATTLRAAVAPGPAAAELIDRGRERLAQRLARLQAYLVPKVPYLDTIALAAAYHRAEEDAKTTAGEASERFQACAKSGTENLDCATTGPNSEATSRMKGCDDTSFLPF
jgi:hypothetical protein